MKIAILSSFHYHFECCSFILEIFKCHDIDIIITHNSDKYNHLKYYSKLYNFNIIIDNIPFSNNIITNYDIIFKLTANDNCLDHSKIISILHLDIFPYNKCQSNKLISLSPYIKTSITKYIFPFFNPILIPTSEKKKNVVFIGYMSEKELNKIDYKFIKNNNDYIFYFIIYGSKKYDKLSKLNNVTIMHSVDTTVLYNIINNSQFMLSRKNPNYDRFSGLLSLSISFEIPLIIDIKTKTDYCIPGIPFINNYNEIGLLNNIYLDNNKYNKIKNEISIFKTLNKKKITDIIT